MEFLRSARDSHAAAGKKGSNCHIGRLQDIGRKMMRELLRRLPVQKVYLTTVPGKEDFYEKLGFLYQMNFPSSARDEAVEIGVLVEWVRCANDGCG